MTDTTTQTKHKGGGNTKTPLKSRKWCFTLNNYIEDDIDTLTQTFLQKKFNYIFGKEIGVKNSTPHLQGFIESKNAIRFDTLMRLIPKAHLEVCKGSAEQNFKYCSKEGDYYTNIIEAIRNKEGDNRIRALIRGSIEEFRVLTQNEIRRAKILGLIDI